MAVSLGIMYNNVNYALSVNSEALLKLQEQAATGQRINRASDDPSDAYRVLSLASQISDYENYTANLQDVSDLLEVSSTTIQSVMDNISSARTLITQITTGTFTEDGSQRKIASQKIDDLLEQAVSLCNTQHLNQYIFSGNASGTAPYVIERSSDGRITSVKYQGSDSARQVEVAPGVTSDTLLVGSNVFQADSRSTPVFYGASGAKAGTGTSTVTGDVLLSVTNDGTNYKLSIDNGLTYTTVPAGGEANTAVTDSTTGQVLFVDTRSLTSTGTEAVRVPGTYDVFSALISARDMLLNDQNFSASELEKLRTDMVSSLEEVGDELAGQLTKIGGKIGSLENLKSSMDDLKSRAQDESDGISQADISQIAIDLSRRETLYEMSISVASKLFSLSLLDFIE
jgi:flagellar hook-associated protein 3 FlgL